MLFIWVKFVKSSGLHFNHLAPGSSFLLNKSRILAVRGTMDNVNCAILLIDGTGLVVEGTLEQMEQNLLSGD